MVMVWVRVEVKVKEGERGLLMVRARGRVKGDDNGDGGSKVMENK
jgi:hypothetical protein